MPQLRCGWLDQIVQTFIQNEVSYFDVEHVDQTNYSSPSCCYYSIKLQLGSIGLVTIVRTVLFGISSEFTTSTWNLKYYGVVRSCKGKFSSACTTNNRASMCSGFGSGLAPSSNIGRNIVNTRWYSSGNSSNAKESTTSGLSRITKLSGYHSGGSRGPKTDNLTRPTQGNQYLGFHSFPQSYELTITPHLPTNTSFEIQCMSFMDVCKLCPNQLDLF